MRFRLWAQIGVTLAVNLVLLGALAAVTIAMQSRRGIDSFLYTQAREKIRDLGALVEEEFPDQPTAERTAWLASKQAQYNVTLAVFDDTGALVAGPALRLPDSVLREINRDAAGGGGGRRGRRRAAGSRPPPIFTISAEGMYWIGYHFPIARGPGEPPVRHTLMVVTDSLLRSPLLFDWRPWILGICGAIVVSALCWIPVLRRITGSLRTIEHASSEIARGRFQTPVAVSGRDELSDLAQSVRSMAEQLARLIHGQRRFLADVAHELCAPLSRIQLRAGILQQSASGEMQEHIQNLEKDTTHMSALVGDLLSFTRGASREPVLEAVDLTGVVQRAVTQENATVEVDVAGNLRVLADEPNLLRAVSNLIRNAVRYAGADGPIRVQAQKTNGHRVQLTVSDCGPGLPESELEAVFSPFYRLDPARTPSTTTGAGSGLGLAIVKSCIDSCEGTVYCANRKPRGLTVVVELKSANSAA